MSRELVRRDVHESKRERLCFEGRLSDDGRRKVEREGKWEVSKRIVGSSFDVSLRLEDPLVVARKVSFRRDWRQFLEIRVSD